MLDFYDLMRKEGYIYNKININYEKSSVKKGILVFDFEEAIVENLIYVKKNNNASVEKNVEKKLKLLTSFPSMVNEVLNINKNTENIPSFKESGLEPKEYARIYRKRPY